MTRYWTHSFTDTRNDYEHTVILRDDGTQIPMSEDNRDFRVYQAWLAEGNTPEPWNPTPTPEEVTPEGE